MSEATPRFRVEQIDHVELFVPDRRQAAAWYSEVLGLDIIAAYEGWADDPGGPLMISSDSGGTKLALFTGTSQGERPTAGFHLVAFRVDAEGFLAFVANAERLALRDEEGRPLSTRSIKDHGQAFSVYFRDPYGHRLEVTTYDYESLRARLTPS